MSEEYLINVSIESTISPELGSLAVVYSNKWNSNSPTFQILFQNQSCIYEGSVDLNIWRDIADSLEIDPVSFQSENKSALTNQSNKDNYKYVVRKNSEDLVFTWLKVIGAGSIKCGQIELKPKKEVSAFDFLCSSSNIIDNLRKELQDTNKKLSTSEEDYHRLTEESEKILASRVTAEEQLFDKFHLLLNQKKRKIRDLEQDQY